MISKEEVREFKKDPKTGKKVMVFTLDDGQKLTVAELCIKLKCTMACARARLNKTSDPEKIFSKVKVSTQKRDTVFVASEHLFNPRAWCEDPLVKLMLKK